MALVQKIALHLRTKLQLLQECSIRMQCYSSYGQKVTERVVMTDDGSTIVCWHPEKPFPYECSRPIPVEVKDDTNTVLKVQNISEVYDVFKPKSEEQTREELMKLTSTSKHVWFPRGKKYYKKKPVPRKREFL